MAFRVEVLVFVSVLFSAALMVAGIFFENKYLNESQLFLLDNSPRTLLNSASAFVLLTTIVVEIAFVNKRRWIVVLFQFGSLTFEILFLIYGAVSIKSNSMAYKDKWIDIENAKAIKSIEDSLKCCGFNDQLMSASQECPKSAVEEILVAEGEIQKCETVIMNEIPYRKNSIIIFSVGAILFNVYAIFVLISMIIKSCSSKPSKNSVYEDMLESID